MTILPKSIIQKAAQSESVLTRNVWQHPIRRGLSAFGVSLLLMLQLAEMPFAAAAPKPPGRGGLPQTKEAAAARAGGCDAQGSTEAERSMVAMVPDYPSERAFVNAITEGYTAQPAPELWANLPYAPEQLENLTFKIVDAERKVHYEVDLDLPKQTGLLKIQWPESKPLKAGERYRWSITATLDCDGAATEIQRASAWIEHYEIDASIPEDQQFLNALSETDDPVAQAELYSEFDLWYDAFALLAVQHHANPAELRVQKAWHRLLSLHGLCNWSMQPFIDQS